MLLIGLFSGGKGHVKPASQITARCGLHNRYQVMHL